MAIDHVVIVGAGAIGSLYAAKLAPHAHVHVVARKTHVDAINLGGLRVTGVEALTARVSASVDVGPIAPRTLMLLTTKVNDNRAAIEPLVDRLLDDTIILCIQNGFGGEHIVTRDGFADSPAGGGAARHHAVWRDLPRARCRRL